MPTQSPSKNPERLGSLAEVAVFLNVAPLTVRRLIRRADLPATRIGNQIRIRWEEVDKYVARKSIPPAPGCTKH